MQDPLTKQTEDALNSLFDAINKMGGDKDVMAGVRAKKRNVSWIVDNLGHIPGATTHFSMDDVSML